MGCGCNKASPPKPFEIRCLDDSCTTLHAGTKKLTQIDDEIKSKTEFGNDLKAAQDEAAQL